MTAGANSITRPSFAAALRRMGAVLVWVIPLHAWGEPPLGLPPQAPEPEQAKVELGKRLFFDARLSADRRVSCASCHRPELAFTDGLPVAKGAGGRAGTRNTPSLLNAGYSRSFFWEGRRQTLESQVTDPFFSPVEHGLRDPVELLASIGNDPGYRKQFSRAFPGDRITIAEVSAAIAAYVRSLDSGNSPFDRYDYGGDKGALSASALRGLELFRGSAGCAECHVVGEGHALFTDHRFHSLGVGLPAVAQTLPELAKRARALDRDALGQGVATDPEMAALGRFLVTGDPADIGRFKTPSLRNVALTAPYMHDGSVGTLEEAVEREIYYRGLSKGRPLILTTEEKANLVEFLRSLTGDPAVEVQRPADAVSQR